MATFIEKYQTDKIEFPGGFDFDNIVVSFNPELILENIKVDYFQKLLDTKAHELKGQELEKNESLINEAADFLANELKQYKIDIHDIKDMVNQNNTITIKLLEKVSHILSIST